MIVAPSLMGCGGEGFSPDAANGMGDRWKCG